MLGKKAPIELLTKSSSILSIPLKVFVCVSFVHNHSPTKRKLDTRALTCVFLGYSPTQKDTNVTMLLLVGGLYLWMSLSINILPTSNLLNLLLRGRVN